MTFDSLLQSTSPLYHLKLAIRESHEVTEVKENEVMVSVETANAEPVKVVILGLVMALDGLAARTCVAEVP